MGVNLDCPTRIVQIWVGFELCPSSSTKIQVKLGRMKPRIPNPRPTQSPGIYGPWTWARALGKPTVKLLVRRAVSFEQRALGFFKVI